MTSISIPRSNALVSTPYGVIYLPISNHSFDVGSFTRIFAKTSHALQPADGQSKSTYILILSMFETSS